MNKPPSSPRSHPLPGHSPQPPEQGTARLPRTDPEQLAASAPNGPGLIPVNTPEAQPDNEKPNRRISLGAALAMAVAAALVAALMSMGLVALFKWGSTSQADGGTSIGRTIGTDPKAFVEQGTVNWAATAANVGPSVVSITMMRDDRRVASGSGVIIDSAGHIVTNNHVVVGDGSGSMEPYVTTSNNKMYKAKLLGADASTDLAVIKVDTKDPLSPIKMADFDELAVGQPVMAIGNPLGYSGTVTTGIISALHRPISMKAAGDSDAMFVTNAVQTSAPINPGNSGGALVDGTGKLIGINTLIARVSEGQSGNIGIGFAIPNKVVSLIAQQLIANGEAKHATMGVYPKTADVTDGQSMVPVALISRVKEGSAADKAGLRKNDAITAIDGHPVISDISLIGWVRSYRVGQEVRLTVLRDGNKQDVKVTLE